MGRRDCVIRVPPAPAISPARILPVRLAWLARRRRRGGLGRRARVEPLTDGHGRVLVVPGRAAAGSGMTLFPSESARPCRVPATAATAAGRDALAEGLRGANRRRSAQASAAGGRGLALPRSSPVRGGQLVTMAGRSRPARRRGRAGPRPAGPRPQRLGRREHSSCHRCRQARNLAPRLASATDGLSRLRGNASATSTGNDKSQADGHALLR